MRLRVNGVEHDFPDGSTLFHITEAKQVPAAGVAVAVDGTVVPRATWPDTVPVDGSSVEILVAVQGG